MRVLTENRRKSESKFESEDELDDLKMHNEVKCTETMSRKAHICVKPCHKH